MYLCLDTKFLHILKYVKHVCIFSDESLKFSFLIILFYERLFIYLLHFFAL